MVSWPPPWPWIICLITIIFVALGSLIFLILAEGRNSMAREIVRVTEEVRKRREQIFDVYIFISRVDCTLFSTYTPEDLPSAVLYRQELWQVCYGKLHPAWLLAYRVLFLTYFMAIMAVDLREFQWRAYTWFTQWNFTMLIFYFAMGTYFSLQACMSCPLRPEASECPAEEVELVELDGGGGVDAGSSGGRSGVYGVRGGVERGVGVVGYSMQACYQVALPLALVVDAVFWIILFPATIRYHHEKDQLTLVRVTQHAVNLVAVSGEFALNSMRFPCFRFCYMLLWVSAYVISQWVLHDVYHMRWAYDFLANDKATAPIWYLGLLLFHLLCYQAWRCVHRFKAHLSPVHPSWWSHLMGQQLPRVHFIADDLEA